jgi:hypothetical protein
MKAASAEKCAIIAHVRSSAEIERPEFCGAPAGESVVFTALLLRERALCMGRIVACARNRTR